MKKIKILAAGLIASALVLVGGVAYASIPGPDGVIHGCVATSGKVLIIDSSATCPSGQTALNWNQTGPAGPAGADGVDGTDGVSGYERVVTNQTVNAHTSGGTHADCPSGKQVLGGGYLVGALVASGVQFGDVTIFAEEPDTAGGGVNIWKVSLLNNTDDSISVRTWAICANVS